VYVRTPPDTSSIQQAAVKHFSPLPFVVLCVVACICVVSSGNPVWAQTDGILQIDDPLHRFLERQETRGHLPNGFVSAKPLSAYEAQAYLDTLATRADALGLSDGERRWIARFRQEVPQPGAEWAQRIWSPLYDNGRDLASVRGDGYALQLNPLVYASLGRASVSDSSSVTTWRNTRGVRASGHVGPIFFETRLTENQEKPVEPVTFDEGATTERLGFVNTQVDDYYDYFRATGVVGVRSRFFEVRFGRDRNRWGPGRGSVSLSNYATVYDQLQVRTSVWRIQYTNLFTRFTQAVDLQPQGQRSDAIQPRPYGAFHRLAIKVTDRVEVELFETIVFATDQDSTVSRTGFDAAYLNPVIFYRSVEQDLGSPDNAMLGIGASWIALDGVQLYGQFLLDELVVGEIGQEWWGNKWGWMAGAHVSELGLDHLDARVEYARLRPYLYAHEFRPNAFVHYGDVLGHPAGPNSLDATLFLNYSPPSRLQAGLVASYTRRGRNTATQNFGANPEIDNDTRVRDRPVSMLQGVRQTTWLVEGHVGVEVLPQLFVDAALVIESTDDAEVGTSRIVNPSVSLRWGLPFATRRY